MAAVSDPFGLLGQVLENRYRIDACVGEGGFGVVYRATHTVFDKPVAIKLLKVPAHFVAEVRASFVRKFIREGQLVAGLSEAHPAVVKILDVGVVTLGGLGVPYLALEWLDGQTLEEHVEQRGPLGEAQLLELFAPVVEALAKAHGGAVGQVIAHRDIKPQNLFVTTGADGRHWLRVLDFGIAKVMQEGDDATRTVVGATSTFAAYSPPFGAPEQFNPEEIGATGPATDVHALGLVVGYALTGRTPYRGKNPIQMAMEALGSKRPTPRALGANVSDALESVCAKALALMPGERYRTAGELGAALRAVRGDARAEAARPEERAPRPPVAAVRPPAPIAGTAFEVREFDPRSAEDSASGRARAERSEPRPAARVLGTELGVEAFEPRAQVSTARASAGELPTQAVVDATAIEPRRPNRGPLALGVVGAVALVGIVVLAMKGGAPTSTTSSALEASPSATANMPAPSAAVAAPPPARGPVAAAAADAMVSLPGGSFTMGGSKNAVTVAPFALDVTEVTVDAYAACGKCSKPDTGSACNWGVADRGAHPINCVDWNQATAYCGAQGKRLPTEEEWEWAARGQAKGTTYPWGNEDPGAQVCWDGEGNSLGKGKRQSTCRVGSYARGDAPGGIHDLAGNVWEWTSSNYGASSERRVVRGGSWLAGHAGGLRASSRSDDAPSYRLDFLGFRCARTPG